MPTQALLLTSAKVILQGNRGSFSNNLSFKPFQLLTSKSPLKCHSKPHCHMCLVGLGGQLLNGPTTKHPLGDISFLTPAPFICTQGGESGHIPVKVVLLLSSFAPFFLPPPRTLFLPSSSEYVAHTTGLGRPRWRLFPPREKEGDRQRGQNARQSAWLQSPAWDLTLDTSGFLPVLFTHHGGT